MREIPRRPDNSADWRAQFRAVATRARRWQFGTFVIVAVVLLVGVGLPVRRFQAPVFITLFGVVFASIVLSPKTNCPASGTSTNVKVEKFCPECGSGRLYWKGPGNGRMSNHPHCYACNRDLGLNLNGQRGYVTRACTHCGAWLDDKGI
jgi:hypothetical protein